MSNVLPEMRVLVESHVGLARSIAFRVYKEATHALELDDLTSVAFQGLTEAAARWPSYCEEKGFDPTATNYFVAFSHHRIRGAIYDYLRAKDWAPRSLRERSKKIREAGQADGLSPEELAERTGLSVKEVKETLSAMSRSPISLDSLTAREPHRAGSSDDEIQLEVMDLYSNVEATASVSSLLESFVAEILKMPKECQVIIALHYYKGVELKRIASLLDLTEARTSQLHVESTSRLLKALKSEALGLLSFDSD